MQEPSEPTYTLAQIMTALSQALANAVATALSAPTGTISPLHGDVGHPERMRRHAMVLGTLLDAGGSMTYVAFAALCRKAGYTKQGYGGFYATRKSGAPSLCSLANGTVTITDKGKEQLLMAKGFLGID